MSGKSSPERGKYLATGWRVVGSGAEDVVTRAEAQHSRVTPGEVRNTLYAVQCTFPPSVQGRRSTDVLLDVLTDELRQSWEECPRLARDEPIDRPASRFGGICYDVMQDPGREWIGELVWRAVHPVVPGAPITTHVLIEERAAWTRLSVRVTADRGAADVRGFVGAGQAQPAFIRALRGRLQPTWLGAPVAPQVLREGEIPTLVRDVLPADDREFIVAILSPTEDAGFVLDPDDLAWDLFGRARLYVIPIHRMTFDLSDAVGDRSMSCYWGAARSYMPGWTRYDDPRDHPLLVADRLADPFMRAAWFGELGIEAGLKVQFPPSIDDRRVARHSVTPVAPAPPKSAAPENVPASPVTESRDDAVELPAAAHPPAAAPTDFESPVLLRTLLDEVHQLGMTMKHVADELERLRTLSSVRSSSTSAIERRLGRLEDLLEQVFPDGTQPAATRTEQTSAGGDTESDDGAPTVADVVHDMAEAHTDALVFLDTAFDASAASPYEDPERVRAILDAMAQIARRRRDGALGTSLREAFADLGIDYRAGIARTTPARLREQYRFPYRGSVVEAEEHIVLGNTYDPRRCLRVYFSSRVANEARFVIGHVGRHFDVISTT